MAVGNEPRENVRGCAIALYLGCTLASLKYVFVFFVLATGWWKANAQVNLVPNWSFEEQDSCQTVYYNFGSNIYYTKYWFSPFSLPNSGGAVELYSSCATIPDFVPPSTVVGHQVPFDGDNYAGIFLVGGAGREYIEVELNQPLEAGLTYCLRFRYSFANTNTVICDGLGAYFSTDSLMQLTSLFQVIPIQPQVSLPDSFITIDTLNWLSFEEDFESVGNELFLTIGNFKINDSTYWEWIQQDITPYCYILLDAVEVFQCDGLNVNEHFSNKPSFILYPNPTSSNTTCEIQTSSGNVSIVITDVTGRKLLEIESENGLVELPTSTLANGLYIVLCKSNGQIIDSEKLLVQR